MSHGDALAEIGRILDRGDDTDEVLREVVDVLHDHFEL